MNPLEALTGLAVRYLDSNRLHALRTRYHAMRTALFPVMRAVYGTFDTKALRTHLETRVGRNFEILMVHSSVNHMQPMFTDSPLDLVRMLIDFCGPERTLAMPAFYFGDTVAGLGARATFEQRPVFDLRKTASQMGLATELFRRSKNVVQSRHPVYRVAALGPLAQSLTSGHENAASPSGLGTPFDFMANHDTLILGIGKRYEVLTQVHHIEDVLGEAFPVPGSAGKPLPMTLVDGKEQISFLLQGRSLHWQRDMWKLRGIMNREQLQEWQFHHVPLFQTRARDVTAALAAAAKRGVTLYKP